MHVRADPLDLGDLQLQQRWGGWSSYAASKLANVLFTRELQRRYADQGLTSIAIHPGGVRTRLGADGDMRGLIGLGWRVLQIFLLSAKKGAAPVVDAAAEPAMREHGGGYFNRHKLAQPSAAARDADAAEALWRRSAELTHDPFPNPKEAPA